jgi:branched-chain amino acid transport system substrate-binding protein
MSESARSSLRIALTAALLAMVLVTTACGPKATSQPPTSAAAQSAPAGGNTPESKAQTGTTYKIGFIASITGKASFLGEPQRNVALMLQKQLDAQGGIKGPDGVMHPVKLLINDSQGSGDVTIPIVKKLIDDEQVVALIGDSSTGVSMAMVPVAQEAQVVMFSMASSSAIVEPVAERKWIFKSAQNNRHTAPTQVKYAKAKNLTKIANFYVNDAYGEDGAKAIREVAQAEGLQIVMEETFGAADTDMTAQLTKLKASDAQALLVTAIPPAAAVLTKQFREMGLSIPLIHNHGIGMKSFISLAGEANAEGVLFPMGKLVAVSALPDSDPQKKVLQDFQRDYEASASQPVSTFAGHGWDAVQITLRALEKLPEGLSIQEQRARLRDEIEKVSGFAGTAGVFNLSPQDHVGLSPDDIVMARITKGDWEYYPPEKW